MAAVLDRHAEYQRYLQTMYDHDCRELALSYDAWCAGCREAS